MAQQEQPSKKKGSVLRIIILAVVLITGGIIVYSKISFAIDELLVLDVSRTERKKEHFSETLKVLTQGCFMPIAGAWRIACRWPVRRW